MIEIVEGLYLGNRESARDRRRLRQAGITHIINCAEELPNYHQDDFTYLALGLRDPDSRMHEHFAAVCTFIDDARQKQGKVLVHCYAAISRSPAIVMTYLCHLGNTMEAAAQKLGDIVWTDPDWTFLEQLAGHRGDTIDDERLMRLSLLLQGRRDESDR
jgi:hypothetical protein